MSFIRNKPTFYHCRNILNKRNQTQVELNQIKTNIDKVLEKLNNKRKRLTKSIPTTHQHLI